MTETLTICPICDSPNLRERWTGDIMVSVCRDCDQSFVNPRMTDDEATVFYQGEYWNRMSATGNNVRDNINTVRHRERARIQALELHKWFIGLHTMLEIGSATGFLLDQLAQSYDMECIGVEPDLRYHQVEPAKRYKLYPKIEDIPPVTFDLIAMSHSLEHLNRPREFMEDLIEHHTHPSTRFMIEVPNLDVIVNTLTNQHPFAFTETTLNNLMARLGFIPLRMVKHGLGNAKPSYLLGMYGSSPEDLTYINPNG